MLNKVAVGIPTIVYAQGLKKAVTSLVLQDIDTKIYILCNGKSSTIRGMVDELQMLHPEIESFHSSHNLGVSSSWNALCETAYSAGFQHCVIIGDDIELLDEDALKKFDDAVKEEPRAVYYVYDRGFSAYCLPKAVYDEIGGFDEGFWPGYFEDNDYYRRMMLAGIGWQGLFINTTHVGSASIHSDDQLKAINSAYFPLNRERYVAKWGGMPHQETFDIPFNGQQAYPDVGGNRE